MAGDGGTPGFRDSGGGDLEQVCPAAMQGLPTVGVERERVGGRPSYRLAAPTGPELQGLDRWHTGVVKSAGRFLATRPLLALRLCLLSPQQE